MMEFFKLHATMYVQHVVFTLKNKLVFLYNEKNSRWTLSSLVVAHCMIGKRIFYCALTVNT